MSRASIQITSQALVPDSLDGKRLDQAAAALFPDYSRGRLQTWIREGALQVNSSQGRPKDRVFEGDELRLDAEAEAEESWVPEAQELDIVHEDEEILVINKGAGVVVHPAAGHRSGTLLNGLLHYCPELNRIPRAGIVHRLDRDTTGLMVVAKTLQAHLHLVNQLQARTVSREYEAIVNGVMTAGGTVDQPLGRHPVNRKKRAVVSESATGKEAISHYRVLRRFRAHSHTVVRLETGRTHQIRVHMSHIRYPLVGDPLYGGRLQIPRACSEVLEQQLQNFRRQALHARRLGLIHPASEESVSWECELPQDMQELIGALESDQKSEH